MLSFSPEDDFSGVRSRGNPAPQFVEVPVVEERDSVHNLRGLHLEVPGVRILVGFAVVRRRRRRIEQRDDHVAVGENAANHRNERLGHSGVEGIDDFGDEFVLAAIGFSQRR